MKMQHDMIHTLKSLHIRLLFGLLSASVLATLVFEILSWVFSANSAQQAGEGANFSLRTFLAIWMIHAFFAFVIAVCAGVPIFWLALRLRVVNIFAACGAGLMLGLALSTLYGGVDIRSSDSTLFALAVFGIPGLIGGLTCWVVIKGGLKLDGQHSPNSSKPSRFLLHF